MEEGLVGPQGLQKTRSPSEEGGGGQLSWAGAEGGGEPPSPAQAYPADKGRRATRGPAKAEGGVVTHALPPPRPPTFALPPTPTTQPFLFPGVTPRVLRQGMPR
jgi:hypothetical protein